MANQFEIGYSAGMSNYYGTATSSKKMLTFYSEPDGHVFRKGYQD